MPPSRGALLLAAGLALAGCARAGEVAEGACAPLPAAEIADPLGRDGLSALRCPAPEGAGALILVTDENLTWPVIEQAGVRTSLEAALLDAPPGPGLHFHRPGEDRVLWKGSPPGAALVSLTGADPVTLEPTRRWLVIDLAAGTIAGVADSVEAALGLGP